jgi:hypothetical protein
MRLNVRADDGRQPPAAGRLGHHLDRVPQVLPADAQLVRVLPRVIGIAQQARRQPVRLRGEGVPLRLQRRGEAAVDVIPERDDRAADRLPLVEPVDPFTPATFSSASCAARTRARRRSWSASQPAPDPNFAWPSYAATCSEHDVEVAQRPEPRRRRRSVLRNRATDLSSMSGSIRSSAARRRRVATRASWIASASQSFSASGTSRFKSLTSGSA